MGYVVGEIVCVPVFPAGFDVHGLGPLYPKPRPKRGKYRRKKRRKNNTLRKDRHGG